MEMKHQNHLGHQESGIAMYKKLGIMLVISFIAMYILMYAMVDRFINVIPNINQFYMAALMTMPMLLIELIVMAGMYKNKKLNMALLLSGAVGLVFFFICIHQQVGVKDKQFLKSMIPHHAAAILMVEKADLSDPEVKKLADGIIATQQKEIEQMKNKIKELENK
ncbi:MAG: DUF305 domain-containing protein [Ferruginibacter sp.]